MPRALPMLNVTPVCPAATPVEAALPANSGVICGVFRADQDRKDSITEGKVHGVMIREKDDPSTLRGYCCGNEMPLLNELQDLDLIEEHGRGRRSYTACPAWIEERKRLRGQRSKRLFPPQERAAAEPLPGTGEMDPTDTEVAELFGKEFI